MIKTAYCKINLTLEILGTRRNDGFHDLKSVMHKIPFGDVISLEAREGTGIVNFGCDKEGICPKEKNLAYLAATEYIKYFESKNQEGKSLDVDIFLRKCVPTGAGLGGGSADAACVLDMLNAIVGAADKECIEKMAQKLGSDVVFCLDEYKSAYCTGRGEKCENTYTLPPDTSIVLAKPAESLNTSGIYKAYDEMFPENYEKNNSDEMLFALAEKNTEKIANFCVNDFESVCIPRLPVIKDGIEKMKSLGAYASRMSGSGSAVYGLFCNEVKAEECEKAFPKSEYECVKCFSAEDFKKMYSGE